MDLEGDSHTTATAESISLVDPMAEIQAGVQGAKRQITLSVTLPGDPLLRLCTVSVLNLSVEE